MSPCGLYSFFYANTDQNRLLQRVSAANNLELLALLAQTVVFFLKKTQHGMSLIQLVRTKKQCRIKIEKNVDCQFSEKELKKNKPNYPSKGTVLVLIIN